MAKQQLNGAHVGAGFQQMDSESVSQRMRRDRFGNAAKSLRLLARQFNRVSGDVAAGNDRPGRATAWACPLATSAAGFPAAWGRA